MLRLSLPLPVVEVLVDETNHQVLDAHLLTSSAERLRTGDHRIAAKSCAARNGGSWGPHPRHTCFF